MIKGDKVKDAVYDEFIDRLRSECDIVSILSDYVPLKTAYLLHSNARCAV